MPVRMALEKCECNLYIIISTYAFSLKSCQSRMCKITSQFWYPSKLGVLLLFFKVGVVDSYAWRDQAEN